MSRSVKLIVVIAWALIAPATAYAQTGEASITGVVKDASGAVLPGVTVEAASPALIEKVRTAVTDSTGQYRLISLVPGAYSVTFTLPGFNTVRRDGLQLAGSFTATVNADLPVGAVAETITVTGETPVVDVQSNLQQRVLDRNVIDTIPAGRTFYNLAVMIPGVTLTGGGFQDVGGSGSVNATPTLTIHGSTGTDQKWLQNGVSMTAMASTGYDAPMPYNPAATQEVRIDTSGMSIELGLGGVRINVISRDGGNAFSGTFFGNYANNSMQGNNLTDTLKAAGFTSPDSIKVNYEMNPGFGGPIKKNVLWFYGSYHYVTHKLYPAGIFNNLNANIPTAWTYVPDLNSRPENGDETKDGQVRLTWQADTRNKLGFVIHRGTSCSCPTGVSPTRSPEAENARPFPKQYQVQVDWTNPLTNRLLLEASALTYYGQAGAAPADGLNPLMIGVTEQSTGLIYRTGDPTYRNRIWKVWHSRAAVSYITGAHDLKVGLNHTSGYNHFDRYMNQPLTYQFNNGVPNQLTEIAYPSPFQADIDHDMGLFAQDKWAVSRLTVTYGARFDWWTGSYPEMTLGPTPLTPTRNKTYPASPGLNWRDVTPRVGVAYDLFGNGHTALKASANKYLEGMGGDGLAAALSPVNNLVLTANRSWTDSNRNFVADCDLTNPAAQNLSASGGDVCGALNPNFGKDIVADSFDPQIIRGWGSRSYNWEFSAGVQQQVIPRVAVNVDYFRRIYGNFRVTDNLALAPSDYDKFTITAPSDTRLPGGGGYTVGPLYNVNPAKFALATQNFDTFAAGYGDQMQHWNGIDVNVNARDVAGILIQGGFSTGRTSTDNCALLAALPESGALAIPYCHQDTDFLTQVKLLGSYRIPKVDTQVAATFQSLPGPNITANFTATNAIVSPSLGRPLAGGAANVTVNLVAPGTLYGERLNQLDLRFSKIFRIGKLRTMGNFDLYNLFNNSAVLAVNNSYAAWLRPTTVLQPRSVKVSAQLDF